MKVSVSFLSNEYKSNEIIKKANNTDCDYLHVDIMDGKFVKNKSFTYGEVKKLVGNSNKKLDVHLMVSNPLKYIEDYALLNTEYLTFHYENVKNIDEVIETIKSYGLKVGISIKPKTNIKGIIPYLENIDQVLIMSVEPGASGQEFKESILYKIEVLRKTIDEKNLKTIISVDGGINEETAGLVKEKGADMVVSSSFVANGDMSERINSLR